MDLVKRKIEDIIPYENNPRFNAMAIEPVEQSIQQVGYISPIILDENNVVLAGHTRLAALCDLGFEEVDCVVITGLSDEQKRKFRLLDNKTAEIAEWDIDLLLEELESLDLGDIHWFDDIVNPAVTELSQTEKKTSEKEKEDEVIVCPRCGYVFGDEVASVFLDDDSEYTYEG